MVHDARSLDAGAVVETDICVIGAGAAGIALAREFAGKSFRVCLLESGGLEPDAFTLSLSGAENVGHPYNLNGSRLRYFGGTTNHWTGYCRPLHAYDFEAHDWVPHSGWPISRTDLDPFYARANALLELGPFRYSPSDWTSEGKPFALDPTRVVTDIFQFSPPTRFGTFYRDDVLKAENVSTFLHANAVELLPDAEGKRIESVRVATTATRRFDVKARWFVLATGGLENARLLLASNSKRAAGLGNEHDLVGRYFMEHPHIEPAEFLPLDPARDMRFYTAHKRPGRQFTGTLVLPPRVLAKEKLLQASLTFAPPPVRADADEPDEARLAALAAPLARALRDLLLPASASRRTPLTAAAAPATYRVTYRGEQSPNPQSRVTLSEKRDALGQQRLRLDWVLHARDVQNVRRTTELIAFELGRAGVGRTSLWRGFQSVGWPLRIRGGMHHMGTTRMAEDPKHGVVDRNCRVHGLANLYVAGSSVYPTSGSANPTLTLLALGLRLAGHLQALLS